MIVGAPSILLMLDELCYRDVDFLQPVLSASDVLVSKSHYRWC